MVVENTCAIVENAIDTDMAVGADIEKEDAHLNTSQKQEKKGNVCETANESLPDSVQQEFVGIVDESQDFVAVVDKSCKEPDVILGEPMPELNLLNHMVCTSGSQNTARSIKKKKKKK
ncbi:hypothetical protein L7F22_009061 [Adiantum nelumboides]|nr:hypothetical protein [Adiantum nelumboides]